MISESMYSGSPNDPAIDSRVVSDAVDLRHALHRIPEPSCGETETAALLKRFLRERTRCAILEDRGTTSFCAVLDTERPGPVIAFRADMDGVPVRETTELPYRSGNDGYSHACGHDGHAAILAGFAAISSTPGMRAARPRVAAACSGRLLFLFQKGEETGAGAREIVERNLFGIRDVDRIFGLHNLPGFPLGRILTRDGIFACASQGLEISLFGSPSHAAYPEFGRNPIKALVDLVSYISSTFPGPGKNDTGIAGAGNADTSGAADRRASSTMDTLAGSGFATIVGLNAGAAGVPAFGTAAAEGSLQCTLRGESEAAVLEMRRAIVDYAERRARGSGLRTEWRVAEPFPETVNHPSCVAAVREAVGRVSLQGHFPPAMEPPVAELPAPMRWSEDFGHYSRVIPGAFFGLGAGEGHPALHTSGYDFPDSLIPTGIRIFAAIAERLLAQ